MCVHGERAPSTAAGKKLPLGPWRRATGKTVGDEATMGKMGEMGEVGGVA